MENLNIKEMVEIDNTQPTKKKRWYLPTPIIFVAIVILGMLGMICVLFACMMFEAEMHNSTLDEAKSNFYLFHHRYRYNYELDPLIYNENVDIEQFFENSNLVGIAYMDRDYNLIKNYGNVSPDDTLYFSSTRFTNTNNGNGNTIHRFNIHILKDAPFEGDFHFSNELAEFIYYNQTNIWIVGVLIGSLILILYVDLIKSTDNKKWILSSIPIEINFIATMFLGAATCYVSASAFFRAYYPYDLMHYLYYLVHLFTIGVATALFLTLTIDITKRVKAKTFVKTSIVAFSFKTCFNLIKSILSNINILWKYLLIYFGVASLALIHMLEFYYSIFFVFMVVNILIFPVFAYFTLCLAKIINASKQISSGDYDYKVDSKYMYLGFDDLADNLNNISAGMETALEEKLKSELLKTELITNVSHDIKTPLTSIINYSDLICKEEDNEKIAEYSKILHRQSIKLKKLIDDLIEASKASSGNVSVEILEIKLSVFIEQVVGEFEEKLSNSKLQLITNLPDEDISILADGRLLSRVFDNLFNNILKYSLENTRVYLDVEYSEDLAIITLKNTSKYQLNISQDLLTERFIRGDLSRHSDGSGLGLSIAKNLVTSQSADFDIIIDGDLFKVIIKIQTSQLDEFDEFDEE